MGDHLKEVDHMFGEDIVNYKVLHGQLAIDVKNYISQFSVIQLDLDVHSVFQYNQIELFGAKNKPGFDNFLLFSLNDAGFPVFGCLKKIWFIEEFDCYFALNVFDTINFDKNLNEFCSVPYVHSDRFYFYYRICCRSMWSWEVKWLKHVVMKPVV